MPFDNICKQLAETYPHEFAAWLLGIAPTPIEVLKTEVSNEPLRADALTLLRGPNFIFHIEFQVEPETEPPLPLRVLDYWVRVYKLYRLPVEQVVLLLRPTTIEVPNFFAVGKTRHEFRVIKLWEQDPDELLAYEGLMPLAVLASRKKSEALLSKVAEYIHHIETPEKRGVLMAQANILAGLRYDKDVVGRLLREDFMKESVTYRAILEEGVQLGVPQGVQIGEAKTIIRQLAHRFGKLDARLRQKIEQLSLTQLDDLSTALLFFSSKEDAVRWLRQHHKAKV